MYQASESLLHVALFPGSPPTHFLLGGEPGNEPILMYSQLRLFSVSKVGMSRDHTLHSLVEGHVKFTKVARKPLPPQKGRKWIKKPWRKFVNVVEIPVTQNFVLTEVLKPQLVQSI